MVKSALLTKWLKFDDSFFLFCILQKRMDKEKIVIRNNYLILKYASIAEGTFILILYLSYNVSHVLRKSYEQRIHGILCTQSLRVKLNETFEITFKGHIPYTAIKKHKEHPLRIEFLRNKRIFRIKKLIIRIKKKITSCPSFAEIIRVWMDRNEKLGQAKGCPFARKSKLHLPWNELPTWLGINCPRNSSGNSILEK